MPEPATLLVFSLAALVLVAVPGPNLIYITTRSIGEGRRAGLASALGVESGTLVHVAAAAVGLSALLASSAVAFSVVKYAGAAYLVYLGVRTLLRAEDAGETENLPPSSLGRAYRQGLLVQLLNPKVALFFRPGTFWHRISTSKGPTSRPGRPVCNRSVTYSTGDSHPRDEPATPRASAHSNALSAWTRVVSMGG